MSSIKVIINGKECAAERGELLMDIAARNHIAIPHLCHYESLRGLATCRLCLAEVSEGGGRKKVVTSCIYPVMKDSIVETKTEALTGMRKTLLALLLAEAPHNEKIEQLAGECGAEPNERFVPNRGNKCITCGLCVKACEELGCNAIATVSRGTTKKITTPYEEPSAVCVGCAACAFVCPTGCIEMEEEGGVRKIWGKEFPLLRCSVCGEYFMTQEQFDYINKSTGVTEEPICKECKKKMVATKMKTIGAIELCD